MIRNCKKCGRFFGDGGNYHLELCLVCELKEMERKLREKVYGE